MTTVFSTRRGVMLGGLALAACTQSPPPRSLGQSDRDMARVQEIHFAEIEARTGGRIGVAAWNTQSNAWLTHRSGERFAMCSMFKWLLAAQMLQMSEHS